MRLPWHAGLTIRSVPTEISPGRRLRVFTGGAGPAGGDPSRMLPARHGGKRASFSSHAAARRLGRRPPNEDLHRLPLDHPIPAPDPGPRSRHPIPAPDPGTRSRHPIPAPDPGTRSRHPDPGTRSRHPIRHRSERRRRAGHRGDPQQPQNEKVVTFHSLHAVPFSNVQSRNEFENPRPSTPSAPPWHSWGRHCSSHSNAADQLPQDLGSGHVVFAMQDLGLIASSTPAGSPDSAAGIGIISSVLGAAISPAASPCNGSWPPDGATVHAPTAHTSINRSALRIIQTSFDVEILPSANTPNKQPIVRSRVRREHQNNTWLPMTSPGGHYYCKSPRVVIDVVLHLEQCMNMSGFKT
jgi:hypothetical protein